MADRAQVDQAAAQLVGGNGAEHFGSMEELVNRYALDPETTNELRAAALELCKQSMPVRISDCSLALAGAGAEVMYATLLAGVPATRQADVIEAVARAANRVALLLEGSDDSGRFDLAVLQMAIIRYVAGHRHACDLQRANAREGGVQ